jgi:hypothetical protein
VVLSVYRSTVSDRLLIFSFYFLRQYEKHQEKVDPAHAQRHHMEVQAAEAATLGLGVYALHEHHEAHKMHKAEKHERHHQKHDHHHRH